MDARHRSRNCLPQLTSHVAANSEMTSRSNNAKYVLQLTFWCVTTYSTTYYHFAGVMCRRVQIDTVTVTLTKASESVALGDLAAYVHKAEGIMLVDGRSCTTMI